MEERKEIGYTQVVRSLELYFLKTKKEVKQ